MSPKAGLGRFENFVPIAAFDNEGGLLPFAAASIDVCLVDFRAFILEARTFHALAYDIIDAVEGTVVTPHWRT